MQRSIEILTGLSYLIIGLSHMFQPQAWVSFFIHLRNKGEIAGFLIAFIHLPLGLLIAAFHNVWSFPEVIVTLVGWSLTLKSALYFLFPRLAQRVIGRIAHDRAWEFQVAGVFAIALSATSFWIASQAG